MDLKLILLAIVVLVVSISPGVSTKKFFSGTCKAANPHSLNFGKRKAGDNLMFTHHDTLDGAILHTQTKPMNWRHGTATVKITFFEIQSLLGSAGGCIELVDGGVGKNYLNVIMHTQRGGGLNYQVKIYGIDR